MIVLAKIMALYGCQVLPHVFWCCQLVTGCYLETQGVARGLPYGYRACNRGFWKFEKKCFLPPGITRGGFYGLLLLL